MLPAIRPRCGREILARMGTNGSRGRAWAETTVVMALAIQVFEFHHVFHES